MVVEPMLEIPTNPAAWELAIGVALASGTGYKALRLGHDHGGPIVEKYLL